MEIIGKTGKIKTVGKIKGNKFDGKKEKIKRGNIMGI